MRILELPGKEVWANSLMREYLAGVDLGSYRDLSWLSGVPRSGWGGDLGQIARVGWSRSAAGALVLGGRISADAADVGVDDLSYAEFLANKFYIPTEGVDVLSGHALGQLAGRGYALVSNFLAGLSGDLRRETVVGLVSVSVGFEDQVDGTYRFYQRRGQPSEIDVRELDKFPQEGLLAVVFGPDCAEVAVEVPEMPIRLDSNPPEEAAGTEVMDVASEAAHRVAVILRQAGYDVALSEPLGDQGGVSVSVSESGRIYLGWKAPVVVEGAVDELMMAGDMLHPKVVELADAERDKRETIASLLEKSGFRVLIDQSRNLTEQLEVRYT